ncbi:hypothetical protein N0V82_000769 [Gnomoniopsis sp. IMI 355080]|nr:hypothetical protein N0V82_000769 [Gnomoniopsis sp. IMI 355080]
MSVNASCSSNSIPADLPIPNNVTYTVIPGSNASDPWMVNCCAPNPVHLVDDCWEWCEITSDMASFNVKSPDDNPDQVNAVFSTCLLSNNRPLNVSNGLETHAKSSAANGRRISEKGPAWAVTWMILLGLVANVSLF